MADSDRLTMLGMAAFRRGAAAEAAAHFTEAAALALARGDGDTALQRAVEALTAQETPGTRRLFADVAGALRFTTDDPVLRPLLTRALAEEWGPLAPLAAAAAGLVKARAAAGGRIADDALLHAALAAAPVADAVLEEALTQARRALLEGSGDAAFAVALARQCFLNGHAWWRSEEETARAAALRARAEAGEALPDTALATLACYVPLHRLAGARTFAGGAVLMPLLRQQRDEPADEKSIAAALPALTPVAVADDNETPWPRWSGLAAAQTPASLRAWLAQRFPAADLSGAPERPAMLAAGCGTGQYALHLARALKLESVTAIDLSRANLAYAARKAAEAGMTEVRFGQGDILEAAALDRRFGLIECGGVLHQLADPFAGWTALLGVLEPGGLMRVAVHSKVARAALRPLQARLRQQGFDASDDGIRAARHWLAQRRDAESVPAAPAFFTLEGCRHLLFPGAEQPLALGDIARFLREQGLRLIGLDVPHAVRAAFLDVWRDRFQRDAAATDLDNWAMFEQENPHTFAAMIQFWVQKRG
jgi:SAM-dependent methyltransferase